MLTDDEIQQSIEAGERVYREHRGNVRGMTVQPIDDVTYCIARAVERAVVEKLAQPNAEPVDLIPPDQLFVCGQMGAHLTRVRLEQPSAEPVAWATLVDDAVHDVNLTKIAADLRAQNLREQNRGRDFVMSVAPLYVAPQPAAEPTATVKQSLTVPPPKLVRAAWAALDYMDSVGWNGMYPEEWAVAEDLRHALDEHEAKEALR